MLNITSRTHYKSAWAKFLQQWSGGFQDSCMVGCCVQKYLKLSPSSCRLVNHHSTYICTCSTDSNVHEQRKYGCSLRYHRACCMPTAIRVYVLCARSPICVQRDDKKSRKKAGGKCRLRPHDCSLYVWSCIVYTDSYRIYLHYFARLCDRPGRIMYPYAVYLKNA